MEHLPLALLNDANEFETSSGANLEHSVVPMAVKIAIGTNGDPQHPLAPMVNGDRHWFSLMQLNGAI